MKHMVIRSKLLTKISAILSYKLKYSWTAGRQSEQEIINYHITLKRKKKIRTNSLNRHEMLTCVLAAPMQKSTENVIP